ncbi:hypothetical protein [Methylotuvimicrobium sp. KM1]|uniref:hypothetical protein n=1 Tax=Methylotuvimicrobium sp. KM1 TaxID=3377707 RepID=UPI00384CD53F
MNDEKSLLSAQLIVIKLEELRDSNFVEHPATMRIKLKTANPHHALSQAQAWERRPGSSPFDKLRARAS